MRSLIIALISAVMAVLTYIFMSKTWREQDRLRKTAARSPGAAGGEADSGAAVPVSVRRIGRGIGRRTGRRGAFLSFLVLLDFAYGYALLTTQVRALNGHPAPDFFLSLHVWGWAWVGVGVFLVTGIAASWDIPQYTVAALFKAIWGMLYADLWIVQHVPTAWVSVVIWLAFALTVLLIAGWPEPGPAREMIESADGLHSGIAVTTDTTVTTDTIVAELTDTPVADALRDVRAPQEEE